MGRTTGSRPPCSCRVCTVGATSRYRPASTRGRSTSSARRYRSRVARHHARHGGRVERRPRPAGGGVRVRQPLGEHGRPDPVGAHRADVDAAVTGDPQVRRDPDGEGQGGVLGGGVDRLPGRGDQARERHHRHHVAAPARPHDVERGDGAVHDAVEVDVDGGPALVGRRLPGRARGQDPGVVDPQPQPARRGVRLGGRPGACRDVPDVQPDPRIRRPELGRGRGDGVAVDVGEPHPPAPGQQLAGDLEAQAPRRPGHDGRAVTRRDDPAGRRGLGGHHGGTLVELDVGFAPGRRPADRRDGARARWRGPPAVADPSATRSREEGRWRHP